MEIKPPELSKCLIEAFPSHPLALLVLLRPYIDDEMLEEIANADYGLDAQEHLSALKQVRDRLSFSVPMSWKPHEVLNLFRYHETGPTAHRQNVLKRAFCCICLLLDEVHRESRVHMIGSAIDPLTRLLENILALGGEYPEAFAQFITWRLPHVDPDYARDRPFFAVAIFILAVFSRKVPECDIPKLIDWLNEEVELERSVMEITAKKDRLLDMERCSQSDYIWRRVAERLCEESVWIESQAIRERVIDIAGRLIGNNATT